MGGCASCTEKWLFGAHVISLRHHRRRQRQWTPSPGRQALRDRREFQQRQKRSPLSAGSLGKHSGVAYLERSAGKKGEVLANSTVQQLCQRWPKPGCTGLRHWITSQSPDLVIANYHGSVCTYLTRNHFPYMIMNNTYSHLHFFATIVLTYLPYLNTDQNINVFRKCTDLIYGLILAAKYWQPCIS